VRSAETEYLLLAGGDKWTQVRDIRRAKTMMR
jgi:putative component of toxin-antitoxin plasmid stabilization module